MREELDNALVKDFPLLFGDRYGNMQTTCMCWGFPGDGWEPIIREAAEKLEPLIQKLIDETPDMGCVCGHSKAEHVDNGPCSIVWRRPVILEGYWFHSCRRILENPIKEFFYAHWCRFKHSLKQKVFKTLVWLAHHTPLHKKRSCACLKFQPDAPRSSQVKEKFGALRWYMTSATDEMYAIVSEAERKSETICEDCGKPGKVYRDGWHRTLCEECALKNGRSLNESEGD